MIDVTSVLEQITDGVGHYERTAPVVARYLDELYIRINGNCDEVVLSELRLVDDLLADGLWMNPHLAANRVYKLLHRLGRDVTGMAGY